MSKAKGTKRFCSLLREAIKDEAGARKEYRVLRSHAPTSSMKTAIDRIASQEGRHRVKLERMYRNHCR